MKGIIELLNLPKGRGAARTERGEYSYFEIVDSHEPEIGDAIEGELESLGSETLLNTSQNDKFDVFIEDIHSTKAGALKFVSGTI